MSTIPSGHPLGDQLLQQVAARLRLCIREADTVARLGGDEFAILQRGVAEPADAGSLCERSSRQSAGLSILTAIRSMIGVSIGIALAPYDATDGLELLKSADLALFLSKADGRGTYRFFDAIWMDASEHGSQCPQKRSPRWMCRGRESRLSPDLRRQVFLPLPPGSTD